MECAPTEENFFGQGDELVGKAVKKVFTGKEFLNHDKIKSELKLYSDELHKLLKVIGA